MSRIEQIREMLRDDPKDAFLLYALALEHEKAGEISIAITQLNDLYAQQPTYLPLFYKLGKLHERQQLTEQAIRFYNEGIKLAQQQGDTKTLNELKEALFLLEDL